MTAQLTLDFPPPCTALMLHPSRDRACRIPLPERPGTNHDALIFPEPGHPLQARIETIEARSLNLATGRIERSTLTRFTSRHGSTQLVVRYH